MNKAVFAALAITLLAQSPAYAISEKYRKQLEQSGCTQMSELQGCDITKSKAENAKAGFVEPAAPAADSTKSQTFRPNDGGVCSPLCVMATSH